MSKLNPQNATAYVGPGVLRKGGKITPVPNGPLIKKKGPFKGSTLKAGGTIKKAQNGTSTEDRRTAALAARNALIEKQKTTRDSLAQVRQKRIQTNDSLRNERNKKVWAKSYENSEGKKKGQDFDTWYKEFDERTKENARKNPEPKGERTFFGKDNGLKSPCKGGFCPGLNSSSRNGSTIKKAKAGTKVKKAFLGSSMFKDNPIYKKTTELRGKLGSSALGIPGIKPIVKNGSKIKKAQGGLNLVDVTPKSKNDTIAKKPVQNWVNNPNGGNSPYIKLAKKIDKKKAGGMIKRDDGSYSKRGLWDNIRANKGSGKKPTAEMLKQERKIKAKK